MWSPKVSYRMPNDLQILNQNPPIKPPNNPIPTHTKYPQNWIPPWTIGSLPNKNEFIISLPDPK